MSHLDPAPDSPRIRTWNRRILGWGCAPAMAVGLIGGVFATARPEMAQTVAAVGTGLALLVGAPITFHVWRLRRDNRQRWAAAHDRARGENMKVTIVETATGDHEYRTVEREPISALSWNDPGGERDAGGHRHVEAGHRYDGGDRDAEGDREDVEGHRDDGAGA